MRCNLKKRCESEASFVVQSDEGVCMEPRSRCEVIKRSKQSQKAGELGKRDRGR